MISPTDSTSARAFHMITSLYVWISNREGFPRWGQPQSIYALYGLYSDDDGMDSGAAALLYSKGVKRCTCYLLKGSTRTISMELDPDQIPCRACLRDDGDGKVSMPTELSKKKEQLLSQKRRGLSKANVTREQKLKDLSTWKCNIQEKFETTKSGQTPL